MDEKLSIIFGLTTSISYPFIYEYFDKIATFDAGIVNESKHPANKIMQN